MAAQKFSCYCLAHQFNRACYWKISLFLPTAKDVWEVVRDLYSYLENTSQIFELKTRLWKSKQNDRNVTTYYNELVTLWQELDQCYDDVWENSNDSAHHMKREENNRVYMFLVGLNRNLDEVRGRILSRKPLPSTREVFSKIRREESRRKIMLYSTESGFNLEPDSYALLSRGFDSDNNGRKKPWCEHCKKPWHTIFIRHSHDGKIAILIVYVNDIILTGDDALEMNRLKTSLSSTFEIKDLGSLKYLLGMCSDPPHKQNVDSNGTSATTQTSSCSTKQLA